MVIIKFANPPLVEVVFGIEFDAPEFSSVHFGLYWETIRDRFPNQIDRSPFQEDEDTVSSSMPPLRRVWFLSNDKKRLIQLQDNCFVYNWGRVNEETYPHFETIFPEFLQEWNHLKAWWSNWGQSSLKPVEYELIYLNLINKDSGWFSTEDYSKVFTFIKEDFKDYLATPRFLDFQLAFFLPNEEGELKITVEQILNDNDSSDSSDDSDDSDYVVFRLRATSFDADKEPAEWFKSAHDFVVRAFLDLTKKEAQEKWKAYEQESEIL